MKAIVYETYGSPAVLQLKELPKPEPKDNEVLIRTRATTVTAGDWRVRSLEVPKGFRLLSRLALGIFRPRQKILGSELAGTIESVGRSVTRFKVGDAVFAFPGLKMGSYVEYKCMPEDGPLAAKPENLTFDEAAAISFGGTTALDFLRRGKLKRGEKVLVNGASGAVGTAAVQLARHFGAEVTAVCSAGNADLVKSIGANRVIDYAKEDFTENGETYDVIVDTAGTAPFSRCRKSLNDGGRLLLVLGGLADMLKAPWVSMTGNKRIVAGTAAGRAEDLRYLADLARSGEFKPVIDRRYPFERMAEAHAYVDTGRKRGNVVVTLD
ncbi:MAG TPA: NAD(P)-dependent alcohol dehydrogenase [Thermoanaerobaculia bacterium]|nr:NAD(P)-dependent alcohol dehydrogenase [Thermoanaerobaculia bacterium]